MSASEIVDGPHVNSPGFALDKPYTSFIKGLELSELFYKEAVRPILVRHFPGLVYSAALFGSGSEVLGFDTPQSVDHDWGPRLMLFLSEVDFQITRAKVDSTLCRELPQEIHGYPIDLAYAQRGGTLGGKAVGDAVHHSVTFHTVRSYFMKIMNKEQGVPLDPEKELRLVDWLTIPEQILRSVTAGSVFYDGLGQLESIREKLKYYPKDIWLYLLATQWRRISQEEAFMGRCGQVGDELGSRLVAGRLIRDLMKLCFLIERQYAPYIKWLGTAFQQLKCASDLTPVFMLALDAVTWQEREKQLSTAYEYVAGLHNRLGITEILPTKVSSFYDRPFKIIHAERFTEAIAQAIRATITDSEIRALPEYLGAIDQFIDSTDVLDDPAQYGKQKIMYL